MTSAIDLNPNHLDIVERILAEHVPGCEVRAFGSRAAWTARDYSDVDLAVVGDGPLHWRTLSRLREAFEASRLPMRVDVLDWHAISEGFRESIKADCVVVQGPASRVGWLDVSLGDCATLTKGLSYKSAFLNEDGPDLLGLGQFVPGGGAKLDGGRTYSGEYRDKDVARPGDVLIAMTDLTQRGDVLGSPLMVPRTVGDFCLFTLDAGKLEPRKGLDPQFLYYTLRSKDFRGFAAAHATGTTVRRVRPADVLSYEFRLPPLEEQRAIARVLGALDDKIELNRRMSETLEEMARALFRSWFVDFEPVRAKAKGRPSGLPPDLDALFPASFEASELGEIPAGWEVRSLDEIATFTNGLALQRFPPEGDEWLPVIKIAEMKRGYTARTSKASTSIDPRYIVEDGDLLFSWSGSLELVLWTHGRGALNQHLFKVTSDEFPRWFYSGWTRKHLDDFRGIAAGKATTMGHIQRHHLTDAKVVVPPTGLVVSGDKHLADLVRRRVGLAVQSRDLAKQRDTLLPRLVSGESRVG